MPTFASINFSPELASRLVAIDSSGAVTAVETPQAVLSRHPEALRLKNEDGSISTDPLHCNGFPELRHQVATKLWELSVSGKRQARVESILQDQKREPSFLGPELEPSRTSACKIPGCLSVSELLHYQKSAIPRVTVSTGSASLDALLAMPPEWSASIASSLNPRFNIPLQQGGGWTWGRVVQCIGPMGTGKTQLALQLAVSFAAQGMPVLYIASAFGHGCLQPLLTRLRQLAWEATAPSHVDPTTTPSQENEIRNACRRRIGTLLDLVSLQTVFNAHQLLVCLAQVEEMCLGPSEELPSSLSPPPPPRLVILDSASGCLNTEDETLLHRVVLRLKHLARQYNMLVWINNASVAPRTEIKYEDEWSFMNEYPLYGLPAPKEEPKPIPKPKPALGRVWRRVWDVQIALSPVEMEPMPPEILVVQATLEGHPFQNCDHSMTATFCVTGSGIEDIQLTAADEKRKDME